MNELNIYEKEREVLFKPLTSELLIRINETLKDTVTESELFCILNTLKSYETERPSGEEWCELNKLLEVLSVKAGYAGYGIDMLKNNHNRKEVTKEIINGVDSVETLQRYMELEGISNSNESDVKNLILNEFPDDTLDEIQKHKETRAWQKQHPEELNGPEDSCTWEI